MSRQRMMLTGPWRVGCGLVVLVLLASSASAEPLAQQVPAVWRLTADFKAHRAAAASDSRLAESRRGMVVSVSPPGSDVGRSVLQQGGNAVDAAVATAFALAVTWPAAGNIGGGGLDPWGGPDIAGGNLTDDHPISFSYAGVLSSGEYAPTGPKANKLHLLQEAKDKGVDFFGPSKDMVECSSCHDPHVDYVTNAAYRPFLITTNAGSALCLACHIK